MVCPFQHFSLSPEVNKSLYQGLGTRDYSHLIPSHSALASPPRFQTYSNRWKFATFSQIQTSLYASASSQSTDLRKYRKLKEDSSNGIFFYRYGFRRESAREPMRIIYSGNFYITRKSWSVPDSSETHHSPLRPARKRAQSHGPHGSSDRTKDRSYEVHPDRHPPRRTYTMFLVHHWPPTSKSAQPLPKKTDCDTPH